jgi:16S rRNA (cytidine1402-2'-O)-methyltransferase
MPSNLPTTNSKVKAKPGTLYVVATPIGNKDDITLRALNILREVDVIAAEDTRKTRRFLSQHNVKGSLISYHEHNEKERTPELINKLKDGVSIALVSNAGTPSVSDPGYRLIEAAATTDINIVPIPGVSAAIAALSVAGLPTDSFTFVGFLPKKKGKRLRLLSELTNQPRTLIFYESPKRILILLEEIFDTMGNRAGVLAREMTKLHEEFIRGELTEIFDTLKDRSEIKGECALLVAGCADAGLSNWETIRSEIRTALASKNDSVSKAVKIIAKKYGISKNRIYEEALFTIKQMSEAGAQKAGDSE